MVPQNFGFPLSVKKTQSHVGQACGAIFSANTLQNFGSSALQNKYSNFAVAMWVEILWSFKHQEKWYHSFFFFTLHLYVTLRCEVREGCNRAFAKGGAEVLLFKISSCTLFHKQLHNYENTLTSAIRLIRGFASIAQWQNVLAVAIFLFLALTASITLGKNWYHIYNIE